MKLLKCSEEKTGFFFQFNFFFFFLSTHEAFIKVFFKNPSGRAGWQQYFYQKSNSWGSNKIKDMQNECN